MKRRTWLVIGSSLVLGGVALGAALIAGDPPPRPVSLGPPTWLLPALRATIAGSDRLFLLARRDETEILPAGETRAPWRGERLELRAFDAITLAPIFATPIVSAPAGGFRVPPRLLGEHAATLWLVADTIGAASAVDGQVLIEREGLTALNPSHAQALAAAPTVFRLDHGLAFTNDRQPLRINPRTLLVEAALPADLPAPVLPAPADTRGRAPFRTTEARLDDIWFGLPPAAATPPPGLLGTGRALLGESFPNGGAQRLWRARLVAVEPNAGSGSFQGSARPRPPAAPSVMRLDAPTPLAAPTPLSWAGFLTTGFGPPSPPIRPPGEPALLLLHQQEPRALALTRIAEDGTATWSTRLPLARLLSVLPGEASLLLLGLDPDGRETLVALTPSTGAVTTRALAE